MYIIIQLCPLKPILTEDRGFLFIGEFYTAYSEKVLQIITVRMDKMSLPRALLTRHSIQYSILRRKMPRWRHEWEAQSGRHPS